MPDQDSQPAPGAKQQHVFIVGSSRSGTSAFARLLGRHASVAIGIERYIGLRLAEDGSAFTADLFTEQRFFGGD